MKVEILENEILFLEEESDLVVQIETSELEITYVETSYVYRRKSRVGASIIIFRRGGANGAQGVVHSIRNF